MSADPTRPQVDDATPTEVELANIVRDRLVENRRRLGIATEWLEDDEDVTESRSEAAWAVRRLRREIGWYEAWLSGREADQ